MSQPRGRQLPAFDPSLLTVGWLRVERSGDGWWVSKAACEGGQLAGRMGQSARIPSPSCSLPCVSSGQCLCPCHIRVNSGAASSLCRADQSPVAGADTSPPFCQVVLETQLWRAVGPPSVSGPLSFPLPHSPPAKPGTSPCPSRAKTGPQDCSTGTGRG